MVDSVEVSGESIQSSLHSAAARLTHMSSRTLMVNPQESDSVIIDASSESKKTWMKRLRAGSSTASPSLLASMYRCTSIWRSALNIDVGNPVH
jgi:hypothetical protein